MPIETSLNTSPYFDDFNEGKEFYKILFKPGVAVQTRELNQLQTVLQNQIERFGNHVFKSGTIISGCNFEYLTSYNYIKIIDVQGDGQPVQASSYVGYFIKDSLNLTGRVVNYQDGFQSKAPDLSTLYVQYTNSSNNDANGVSWSLFRVNQSLTVFDKNFPLFSIAVTSGGLGFANSDSIVIEPAIVVSGNAGSWVVNERLTQATTAAQVQIISVNTTIIPSKTIIFVKPLTTHLTNTSVNAAAWTLQTGFNVVGNVSAATANVTEIVGSGAAGSLVTDSLGITGTVAVTTPGSGYYAVPFVTIKTANATASIATLSLTPQNYKAVVTVANAGVNAIGVGYGFGVSSGIIYQKGFFLRVEPQVIIVNKYSPTPDSVTVGFSTSESIVNFSTDTSLFDNAANTTNFTAPGADRLKLNPTLTVLSIANAAANVDFFTLVEWKNGFPWKENRTTVYSQLGEEFARRTRESEGNYVVDPFIVSTKDKPTQNSTSADIVIDPGLAYIDGYRVQTSYNNYTNLPRSNITVTQTNQSVTTNYGNFAYVKEVAGLFSFKSGPTIDLYDTAQGFISKYSGANTTITTPSGTKIGTARIRSLVFDNGIPGTPQAIYRAYLFEVVMNQGKLLRDSRAMFYSGTANGVADIVTTLNATTNSQITQLSDTDFNQLLYDTGRRAMQSMSNITFQYRTVSGPTLQFSATGQLDIGPLGAGLTFPYTASGSLTTPQKADIVVFPIANAIASANLSGTFTITTGAANVTGVATLFTTEIKVGDFIKVGNTSSNTVGLVVAVPNNTFLQLNNTSPISVASANGVKTWPANHPIRLSDRTVSLSAGGNVLSVFIGTNITGVTNAIAVYNVRSANAQPITKTVNRDVFVKIQTGNNVGSTNGPWSLGLPDVLRLKNVFLGNSTVVTTGNTNITKYFFVDSGGDQNVYRLSRLVLNAGANASIALANVFLLAQVDVFSTGGTEGFFTTGSYSINDDLSLVNSTATINTLEIPEVVTGRGQYFDLRDTIDFRPFAVNTALITSNATLSTVNPANTFALSTNDKFFPVPDALMSFDGSYYTARTDRVVARTDSTFAVISGIPKLEDTPAPAPAPLDSVTLSLIMLPPYPSLPIAMSNTTVQFINRRVGNDRGILNQRAISFQTSISLSAFNTPSQPRRFTMQDIGSIERRVSTLEYYTALNLLEAQIKSMNIPSSINPAINRFKHGFFVDSFNDYSYAATGSTEFSATIDQGRGVLKPLMKQANFRAVFDRSDTTTNTAIVSNTVLMLPYAEETLINQSIVSGTVSGDGQKVQFIGDAIVVPASFDIRAHAEVAITPAPIPPSTTPPSSGPGSGPVIWVPGLPGLPGPLPLPVPHVGKIICTALHNEGVIEHELFVADQEYGRELLKTRPLTFRGYRLWADYVVRRLKGENKNPLFTTILFWKSRAEKEQLEYRFVRWLTIGLTKTFVNEISYRKGVTNKSSVSGYLTVELWEAFCTVLGTIQKAMKNTAKYMKRVKV